MLLRESQHCKARLVPIFQVLKYELLSQTSEHRYVAQGCWERFANRPRSIYQYSNMAPRLSSQNCKFFQASFVSQFPKGTWTQRKQHEI